MKPASYTLIPLRSQNVALVNFMNAFFKEKETHCTVPAVTVPSTKPLSHRRAGRVAVPACFILAARQSLFLWDPPSSVRGDSGAGGRRFGTA